MNAPVKLLLCLAVFAGAGVILMGPIASRIKPASHQPVLEDHQIARNQSASAKNQQTSRPTASIVSPEPWQRNLLNALRDSTNATASDHSDAVDRAVAEIPVLELSRALALIENFEGERAGRLAISLVIERWAQSEPFAAAKWLEQRSSVFNRSNLLARVTGVWALTDAVAAWEWSRQLLDANDRAAALKGCSYEMARTQPSLAFGVAEQLSPDIAVDVAAKAAANWAEKSPQEALAAANQLTNGPLRQAAVHGVVVTWAEANPVEAGRFVAERMTNTAVQSDAAIGVLQRWAQHDAVAAAAWVANFPSGEVGDTAAENLVKLWAERDAGQVGKWISTITDSRRRDIAVAAYGEKLAPISPDVAALWIAEIQDPVLREQYLQTLLEVWITRDREGRDAEKR